MDMILVKIFATALALSEVTTQSQAVKTHFDPVQDRAEVVQLLRDGCAHMRQAFDIESINLDELIATALTDSKSPGAEIKAFHGINFADLNTAYHQFCKNENVEQPVVDIGQVIEFYNNAAADLPDPTRLKGRKLPSMSTVLDGKGANFANVFEQRNRRVWIPLARVPDLVQKAFIAAEDRRFYQHHGVDERGIIRAFIGNLADSGRPQGGSTITQQVVKNLLVGEDVTYERKIREMIVASRLEATLSKEEILELYLNSAYLGRGSWGVEMAARSYFGKSAKDLSLAEGAMLASLLKGPSYFNPDRHPDRAKERLAYVLGRMQEDGTISTEQKDKALAAPPKLVVFERPRRDSGLHFIDFVGREARADGIPTLTAEPYTVHSTINAALQREAEAALQEGLARFEMSNGRTQYRGPEANIADAVQKLGVAKPGATAGALPAWQQALQETRLPLADVHWDPAVVLDRGGKRGDGVIRVGLRDGRVLPLNQVGAQIRRALNVYDVVYVHVIEARAAVKPKNAQGAPAAPAVGGQVQLRVRPTVQGSALVLENKTGRILAMAGSFSYMASPLNRTSQTRRQPGSAMKPLTYLTALQAGLQPNTLVSDDTITLAPIGASGHGRDIIARNYSSNMREQDFWTPRNADGSSGGALTLRRGLENSVNMVTAHLLDGGISVDPEKSLDEVCATAMAAKIYTECVRYYPFVLGAQPVRMIDLAGFYAAVANEGALPQPHAIEFDRDGRPHGVSVSEYAAAVHRRRRPCRLLSAQDHVAGCRGARHRACDRRPVAVRRRQDRHDRGRGRRMVRRLYQRRDHRRVGRLRQWRRQAPFAGRQRDRSACRTADLRADPSGHLGPRHRAESAAQRAIPGGQAAPDRSADRLLLGHSRERRWQLRRALPARGRWPPQRDAISACLPAGQLRLLRAQFRSRHCRTKLGVVGLGWPGARQFVLSRGAATAAAGGARVFRSSMVLAERFSQLLLGRPTLLNLKRSKET